MWLSGGCFFVFECFAMFRWFNDNSALFECQRLFFWCIPIYKYTDIPIYFYYVNDELFVIDDIHNEFIDN